VLLLTAPRRRGLALAVAAVLLVVAAPVEAKKKKGGKKHHKTPSSKSVGKPGASEPKDSSSESDEGSEADDESAKGVKEAPEAAPAESSSPSKTEVEKGEAEEKAPPPRGSAKPAVAPSESEEPVESALRLVVGGGALFRTLRYSDDRSSMVSPYRVEPGPEIRTALEVFPAAFATTGFAANIGLFGQLDYGFGVKSKAMSGARLTTNYYDFIAGLKVRIPIGIWTPYVTGGYGGQVFQLQGQDATTGPPVPSVSYKFIRGGLGTRVRFSPMFDLDVGAGYVYVTDPGSAAGDIKSSAFFPNTTTYAIDAGLSVGIRLASVFGLRVGGDFRQYGLSFNWQPGQPYQIGGGTDRYIQAWGGIEIILDGVSEAPEKPAPPSARGKAKRRPQAEPEDGAAE
jgi:hypothetical protein